MHPKQTLTIPSAIPKTPARNHLTTPRMNVIVAGAVELVAILPHCYFGRMQMCGAVTLRPCLSRACRSGLGNRLLRVYHALQKDSRSVGRPAAISNAGRCLRAFCAVATDAGAQTAQAQKQRSYRIQSRAEYEALYKRSVEDPDGFWAEQAEEFHWDSRWEKQHTAHNFDVREGRVFTEFFRGGRTNVAYNCLDVHVAAGRGGQACLLWEGNNPGSDAAMTYSEVLADVCRLANWLRSVGVKRGDAVAIYMPMVCELPIAMLACARIGAVHSVVFGGFSADALAGRIADCRARVVLTASGVLRGAKKIGLKAIVDRACDIVSGQGHEVDSVLVLEKPEALPAADTNWVEGRDRWWSREVAGMPAEADVEWVDAEDPLFLLYTSGSTGKPKGVLHSTGGYMVMAATTCKYVLDLRPGDVYWCTADCGWITGHTYLSYGPLLCGATCVVFEGVPTYPDAGRCWEVIAKYQVRTFYTAPTLLRALMAVGDEWVTKHDRSSLAVLGTVGEPINAEAWRWYKDVVGEGRCPIVDTWWQTETGGHMLTPLPGAWEEKPGSATLPFFGVVPAMVDEKGEEIQGPGEGYLCMKQAWPSTIRTVYGDQERYELTYFAPFKGFYFSGDGCRRDGDGYYWITGRVDDVINVSGHRIGTAEVESALEEHPQCAEAAVVGYEHPIKGQGIYAYVTLRGGSDPTPALKKELAATVRSQIGAFAAPDVIHWAPGLPKTRSGKIMRRVLRKLAAGEEDQLGDVSTLADPSVVDGLLEQRGR